MDKLKAYICSLIEASESELEEFIQLGFEAITVAVNGAILDKSFVGKRLDKSFFERLPEGVDPCGENGEFHTFCYKGPVFKHPVAFTRGEIIGRSYPDPKGGAPVPYWFCDILPT